MYSACSLVHSWTAMADGPTSLIILISSPRRFTHLRAERCGGRSAAGNAHGLSSERAVRTEQVSLVIHLKIVRRIGVDDPMIVAGAVAAAGLLDLVRLRVTSV